MLASGTRLGPYEILAPIGAGGMGEVYKAKDARLDRTVAPPVGRWANANATIDVMGDGRLVFSRIQVRQTLRECELIGAGGCADNAATGLRVGTRWPAAPSSGIGSAPGGRFKARSGGWATSTAMK